MNATMLYTTHRAGGTLATVGWMCGKCRKAFTSKTMTNAQQRGAAEKCCSGREFTRVEAPTAKDTAWRDAYAELPDDLEPVLLYDPTAERPAHIGYLRRNTWYVDHSSRRWSPSHWMPLPAPGAP